MYVLTMRLPAHSGTDITLLIKYLCGDPRRCVSQEKEEIAGDTVFIASLQMSLIQVHHTSVRMSLLTNKQHKDCAGLSML